MAAAGGGNGGGGTAAAPIGGGGGHRTAARLALLAARGLSCSYTPISSLATVPRNATIDTVGYLCFVSAPLTAEAQWGSDREARRLFLVDETLQLLCLHWLRPPAEPMPKLRVGAPLCVLDARVEYTHAEPWPSGVEMPSGLEALRNGGPCHVVHHVTAESVGHTPARLVQRTAGGGSAHGAGAAAGGGAGAAGLACAGGSAGGGGAAAAAAAAAAAGLGHLHPRFEELLSRQAQMFEVLTKLSALAMDLVHGRLRPPPQQPPQPQPTKLPLQPTLSAIPSHIATPTRGNAADLSSPPSLSLRTADASPREAAVSAAVMALLQASPDGLTTDEIASQLTMPDGGAGASSGDAADGTSVGSEPASAAEVTRALEALEASFVVYKGSSGEYRMM